MEILASIYGESSDPDQRYQAKEYLEKVTQHDPNDIDSWIQLTEILEGVDLQASVHIVSMSNDNDSENTLKAYMFARENEKYHDGIKILTNIIDKSTDKNEIILYLKHRIRDAFELEDFKMVIQDCQKLNDVGYELDDDKRLLMLLFEAEYKKNQEQMVEKLKQTAIKLNSDPGRALRDCGGLSRQSSFEKN
ncbi:unnamed protein product [Rotaria socialis]|uniref:Uncharacterized protein n=2 Tax=Rotaria socialis TaxID=392032 RepID=A0A820XVF4_9BILA|nr:unnamed protein product [Rotaria socialis]